MKVTAQYAAEHFDELMHAADSGEPVEIDRPEKTSLLLVPSQSAASPPMPRRERILGAGRGELRVPTDDEWYESKRQLERLMNDAPLMTSGEI